MGENRPLFHSNFDGPVFVGRITCTVGGLSSLNIQFPDVPYLSLFFWKVNIHLVPEKNGLLHILAISEGKL